MIRLSLLLALLGSLLGLGPGALERLRLLARGTRVAARPLLAAALLLGALVAFARREVPPFSYLAVSAATTASFLTAMLLALRWGSGPARWLRRWAGGRARGAIAALAVAFLAGAWAAEHFVLGNVPHVSDEVAYGFQARALAQGRLGFDPPPEREFFNFTHLMIVRGRWVGIMPPGWPALLAIGYRVGHPDWVNPLLGAATLPLLASALTGLGVPPLEAGLAVLLIGVSPFALFLAASSMSHTASLFFFALLLFGWARARAAPGGLGGAALAGLAATGGVLARPADFLAAAAPLLLAWGFEARGDRRQVANWLLASLGMASGLLLLLVYNQLVTGDPFIFPQSLYFERRFPCCRFGIGFGARMGTPTHGSQWPGYYPSDAPRVTAHRLLELLRGLHALPLVSLAALAAWFPRALGRPGAARALAVSALALLALYAAHFYHGIAYGARHYFLALPALGLALAAPVARGLAAGRSEARLAAAALAALLLHSAAVAYPVAVKEYGHDYRDASPALREAVRRARLRDALVFVAREHWAWKSAFPLNRFPIGRGSVLYARDLGSRDRELLRRFPQRKAYLARRHADGRVTLEPLAKPRASVSESAGQRR